MKLRKRNLIIAVIAFSVALFVGCGRHRHPWHRGKDLSKHITKRLDRHVKRLDLTENQREACEEIRERLKANLSQVREERDKLINALRGEMDAENPDLNRMAETMKEHIEDLPGRIEENIDLFLEFYNLLDEDQKVQVMQHLRSRLAKR